MVVISFITTKYIIQKKFARRLTEFDVDLGIHNETLLRDSFGTDHTVCCIQGVSNTNWLCT